MMAILRVCLQRIFWLSVLILQGHVLSAQERKGDAWLTKPVDERTFRTYLEFFAYDKGLPFEAQTIDTKEYEGIHREHFSFQGTPGERVFANLYMPLGRTAAELPALILLHGAAQEGKDSPNTTKRAEFLARAGFVAVSMDMKFFGERTTSLLTTFTEAEKHERLYNQPGLYLSWVTQVTKDVGRLIDFLTSQRGVDARRIGFYGLSRGAEVGMIVTAVEQRFRAALLYYGGHFDALETGHPAAACPANYIGRISPRPLLMVNGERDADYDKETSVLPLFKLARQPKQIMWLKGGHMFFTDEDLSAMVDWLHANMK